MDELDYSSSVALILLESQYLVTWIESFDSTWLKTENNQQVMP